MVFYPLCSCSRDVESATEASGEVDDLVGRESDSKDRVGETLCLLGLCILTDCFADVAGLCVG